MQTQVGREAVVGCRSAGVRMLLLRAFSGCAVTAPCVNSSFSLRLAGAGFLPPGRPECSVGGGGSPHLSQDTAGPDCSARSCSWELDSRFALTDASWALPLCWTLFFVTGLPAGSKHRLRSWALISPWRWAVFGGRGEWDAGGRSGWGAVRVQLAVTEEASLRATWDRVSKEVAWWGPWSKRQQA